MARLAPLGWKAQKMKENQDEVDEIDENCNEDNVSSNKNKASWARLIAKIYEVDLPYMEVPMQAGTGRAGACRLSVLNAALKCV